MKVFHFDLSTPRNLSARRLRIYNVNPDPRVEIYDSGSVAGSTTTLAPELADNLKCQAILTDTLNVTDNPTFTWEPFNFHTTWTQADQPWFGQQDDLNHLSRCGCRINHVEDMSSSSSSSSSSSTSSTSTSSASSSSTSSTSTSSLSSSSTSSTSTSSLSSSSSSSSSTSTSSLSSTSTSSLSSSSSSSS